MTVTLVGSPPTETFASPQLAYRNLLVTHRDAMVEGLVEKQQIHRIIAERMIDQLWDRLTDRLVKDYTHKGVDRPLAERIMNEALGFLLLNARTYGHGPSELVDLGWHTFMQYTREYAVFCDAIAGQFIHHTPNDIVGIKVPSDDDAKDRCNAEPRCCNNKPCYSRPPFHESFTTQDTISAMMELGPVDLELWAETV